MGRSDVDFKKDQVAVSCAGLNCDKVVVFGLPWGWKGHQWIESNRTHIYCPKDTCQAQKRFLDSQCLGCMMDWEDCALRKWIINLKTLPAESMEKIRQGLCPYRVNGTFSMFVAEGAQVENFERVDLSQNSTAEDGIVFAKEIQAYIDTWSVRKAACEAEDGETIMIIQSVFFGKRE